jgi:hypothetical protein
VSHTPSELFAGGNAAVVEVSVIVRGIGLQDGEHDPAHPLPDESGRLGLAVIGGPPEVVVLGDGGVVLQEPVQVLASVFKVVLSVNDQCATIGIARRARDEKKCLGNCYGRCTDLKTW